MTFAERLNNYFRAGYGMLSIQTHEEFRVLKEVGNINEYRKAGTKLTLYEWDCIKGLRGFGNTKLDHDIPDETQEVTVMLDYLEKMTDDKNMPRLKLFIIKDLHLHLEKVPIRINYMRMLRNMSNKIKAKGYMLVFISPIFKIPFELEKEIQVIDFNLPNEEDIARSLNYITKSAKVQIEEGSEFYMKSVEAAKGMTENEIDNAYALGLVATGSKIGQPFVDAVFDEKIHQIRKNGLLKHIPSDVSFSNVGGLTGIKEFIRVRKRAFTKEAKDFGIPYPKGILLAGIPGTGKTLIAKGIANEFGCPLFQLDIGSLFSSMVGDTEGNFRKVIQIMESLGHCVVLFDEVEKSLNMGATSGQGDTGTSSRSFGTLLSWMSDRTSPVFIVATSNNHTILPPELIRKGRLDELFWIDLPTFNEREEIFDVVIRKFKRDANKYDLKSLARASNLFTGSEIDEAVKVSLYRAFASNQDLNMEQMLVEMKNFKCFAKVNGPVVDNMRSLAKNKLKIASETGEIEEVDEDKALRAIEVEA
jgi:ATP-dependent 26S proteasome regulatory subunit